MSKSTNTVVYFDWKEIIYVCGKCRTQFMLPMEKSVIFTGACANEIIPSINRSFVYKAKEGGHVRMRAYIEMQKHNLMLRMDSIFKWCQSLPGYTYILLPFCYRQGTRLTISCFTVSVH